MSDIKLFDRQNEQVWMNKKYSKIDLRSDSYKVKKTPEKAQPHTASPISNNYPYQSRQTFQKIDPNYLFQSVCCPNCRYLFKIIKNTEMIMPQSPKKKITTHAVSVQTDEFMLHQLKKMQKAVNQSDKADLPRQSFSSSLFNTGTIKRNNLSKSQLLKEQQFLKQSSFQFPEYSPFKYKHSQQLSNGNSQNKSQTSFKDLNRNRLKSTQKKQSSNSKDLFQEQYQNLKKQIRYQFRRDLYELPDLFSSQFRNSQTIDHLVSYYKDMPLTTDVPSYCKMLIIDYDIPQSKPPPAFKLY